jgi:hypothetical protein
VESDLEIVGDEPLSHCSLDTFVESGMNVVLNWIHDEMKTWATSK